MKLCTLVYLLGSYVFKAPFDILHQNPPPRRVCFSKNKKTFSTDLLSKISPLFLSRFASQVLLLLPRVKLLLFSCCCFYVCVCFFFLLINIFFIYC